jgi:hypothetical protein
VSTTTAAPTSAATATAGNAPGPAGAPGGATPAATGGTPTSAAAPAGAATRTTAPAAPPTAAVDPLTVRAIYLNPDAIIDDATFNGLLALADRTEINAMVLDVKEESGLLYHESGVALAREVGAVRPRYDLPRRLAALKAHGLYSIARIVCMQDPTLATRRPALAVRNRKTGGRWENDNGAAWVNALRPEVWRYNTAVAVEAAVFGFDEIQYDYVRFPSDGDLTIADFGREYTAEARQAAITGFLQLSHDTLGPKGIKLGADIFGYTAFVDDEQGIGQRFTDIVPLVDYVCMMIYPSHFSEGNISSAPGHPNDFPYETILESLQIAEAKVPGSALKFRPWLQDFSMPLEGYRDYGAAEVRAQIDAAEDFGASGWMLWNPSNEYQVGALNPA